MVRVGWGTECGVETLSHHLGRVMEKEARQIYRAIPWSRKQVIGLC